MTFNYSMAACGFLLGLSGCVAVPVAQLAASQIAPSATNQVGAQAAAAVCNGDCGDMAQKWTSTVKDSLFGK